MCRLLREEPDDVLIPQAVAGHEGALKELWARGSPRFLCTIRKMVCNSHDAEELLQEFFTPFRDKVLPAFDPKRHIAWTTFAVSCLRNMVSDFLRRKARRPREVQVDFIDVEIAARDTNNLNQPAFWGHVSDCAEALMPEQREILRLRYAGRTFREISCELFPEGVEKQRQEYESKLHEYHEKLKRWEETAASGVDPGPKPATPEEPQPESLSYGKFIRAVRVIRNCLRSKGYDVPDQQSDSSL